MGFLEELAARRRFGMKPGLDSIRAICAALGHPEERVKAIHVAGTNGKGAVCAILDAALRKAGLRVGRYTSPHLVCLNERFFLDGVPVDDITLERMAEDVSNSILHLHLISTPTFFEALTAVAFRLYDDAAVDYAILECGLGGRLDATNVCRPSLCVITKIGLDHCDWLGDTVEKIAAEKAGIIKPGVPVVLGRNEPSVRTVVEAWAREVGTPFHYAPDLVDEREIPADFSLLGAFNRENAVTALAALKVLAAGGETSGWRLKVGGWTAELPSFVTWPGRFQRVGNVIVDGAHNPPAARALRESLEGLEGLGSLGGAQTSKPSELPKPPELSLIAGFCGDKDVGEVLSVLAPLVKKGYAVRTNNPRSLSAEETAVRMRAAGIDAIPCGSLREAIAASGAGRRSEARGQTVEDSIVQPSTFNLQPDVFICGSLFLAGEALVELGAYPWPSGRFDPSEALKPV